jgi:hypothetical protein
MKLGAANTAPATTSPLPHSGKWPIITPNHRPCRELVLVWPERTQLRSPPQRRGRHERTRAGPPHPRTVDRAGRTGRATPRSGADHAASRTWLHRGLHCRFLLRRRAPCPSTPCCPHQTWPQPPPAYTPDSCWPHHNNCPPSSSSTPGHPLSSTTPTDLGQPPYASQNENRSCQYFLVINDQPRHFLPSAAPANCPPYPLPRAQDKTKGCIGNAIGL